MAAKIEPTLAIALVLSAPGRQQWRFRFYGDGLTVHETRLSHGDGWFPWRTLSADVLDELTQTEAYRLALETGYDVEEPR